MFPSLSAVLNKADNEICRIRYQIMGANPVIFSTEATKLANLIKQYSIE